MSAKPVVATSLALGCLIFILGFRSGGQDKITQQEQAAARKALDSYVKSRLRHDDWPRYSSLVTWTDEPSWDCHWVTRNYRVGRPSIAADRVTIPVIYVRLGVFCGDFDFTPERSTVTVDYELVRQTEVWKVDGPIPDYRDLSVDVLIGMLKRRANSSAESPDRRSRFNTAVGELTSVKKETAR
jgi:hypothetical protein